MGIDFRTKEFLGELRGKVYGTYKYQAGLNGNPKKALCRTTELLIAPDMSVYRCHADLYNQRNPLGHLLDPEFRIEDKPRTCEWFGLCNPCDIKTKFDRFQEMGHCAVEVKEVEGRE